MGDAADDMREREERMEYIIQEHNEHAKSKDPNKGDCPCVDCKDDREEEEEKKKHEHLSKVKVEERTKLSFELESPTVCYIVRDGNRIARMWSQFDEGMTPYPHDKTSYCLNSVQICGFDKIAGPWACGPYPGQQDVVLHFFPIDDEWYKQQGERYAKYVQDFFTAETKMLRIGVGEFQVTDIKKKTNLDIRKLKSFKDWLSTYGA